VDLLSNTTGYNAIVLDHFQNPRNCGELADPDAVGMVRHGPCGDLIKLYLKLDGERIAEARFKTYGCGVAIASSSVLTELLRGKTVAQARQMRNQDVFNSLGGLPPEKAPCSEFAEELIRITLAGLTKTG
jgi:nitrogen fixation NifU-like protein